MLRVTSFRAASLDLDHIELFWEIADHQENILGYDFLILRSESPTGPWDLIGGPLQDQYRFRDTGPALLHKYRTLYYLLRIVNRDTQESLDVGPTAQIPEPDLIALEIIRQEDMLFREHIGRRCWLFPARTFGAKCFCFDKITKNRTRSNCINCFDTGYLGGYLSPVECWVQIDPNSSTNQPTTVGKTQRNNTSARLICFPEVHPDDILVEAENRRWKVVTVNQTERLRAAVRQELAIYEVDRGDIEFKLPVDIPDLKTLSASAERNFTNPQHTERDVRADDLLALYGYGPRGAVR